jgi:hypothetical protein
MPKGLAYTGYILALIGGIILIITGILGLLRIAFTTPLATILEPLGALMRDAFTLILGIIATIGARYVDYLGWAIGLIIIGLIASGLGGALVLVGGILGLVHYLNKPRR